jgi:hypothetical protein
MRTTAEKREIGEERLGRERAGKEKAHGIEVV